MSVDPEIFAIFQHKVERIPHFARVTEVRHMLLFNLFLFLMLFIIYYSVLVYSPFKNEIWGKPCVFWFMAQGMQDTIPPPVPRHVHFSC